VFQSLSLAVRQIAAKVARAGLEGLYGVAEQQGGGSGDTQKKLDVVAVSISARAGSVSLTLPDLLCGPTPLVRGCQRLLSLISVCLLPERCDESSAVLQPQHCCAGK
jgi:hypothetical protein